MTAGPLSDRIWAHTGAQMRETTRDLATLAGGLILTGDVTGSLADQVHASQMPVMLQHPVKETTSAAATLLHNAEDAADRSWLQTQLGRNVAMVVSRTTWVPNPASLDNPRADLTTSVDRCSRFLALAAREVPGLERMALIPVDYRWLRHVPSRRLLAGAIADLDGTVGLMVAHRDDPFASVEVIAGLVELIQAHPSLALLRSDHAALGALALGATGGSIGLTTGSRHLVPPGSRGFANNDDKTARLLVPSVWGFWMGSRFDTAPDLPLYRCNCRVCGGRSLLRFQDERLAPEADRHTVTCWAHVAAQLAARTSSQRQDYWFDLCQTAVDNLDELGIRHGILEHPSRQLASWCEFAGIRVV